MWRAILLLLAYWLFELVVHEVNVHMTETLQQYYIIAAVQCVHAYNPIRCLARRRINTAGNGSTCTALATWHLRYGCVREESFD